MAKSQTSAADRAGATVTGYGVSYAITSIASALLVVLKESSESVLQFLVAITGHHWVTHGLLVMIVFVAVGAVLARRDMNLSGNALIATIVGSTVVSGLIISGFFIL